MMKKPRKPIYSQAIKDQICESLAEGLSLREICRGDGMPSESAVRKWAIEDPSGFGAHYMRAREVGYLGMADQIIEIADDSSGDMVTKANADGSEYEAVDHEHIARSRLRVEARKWILSKALPKVYGDKIEVDNKSSDGSMTPKEVGRDVAEAVAKKLLGM